MKLKTLAQATMAALALSGAALLSSTALAADIDFTKLEHRVTESSAPVVYFTSDIKGRLQALHR